MKKLYSSYADYIQHNRFDCYTVGRHWMKRLKDAVEKRVRETCKSLNISDDEYPISIEKRNIILESRK